MTQRPRILFLSQCLPYPPNSGVTNRTYHILEQLGAEFDVTLLAYSRRGHQPDEDSREEARRMLARVVNRVGAAASIPGEWSTIRRGFDHLRATVSGRPYTFFEYDSGRFRTELGHLVRGAAFDLIHLDSIDLYRWLKELPRVPTTCTHHSVESLLLRLQAQRVRSRVLARYVMYQADLLERVEQRLCPRFSLNLMMSQADAARLRALAPSANTVVVPNGVDTAHFKPMPEARAVPGRIVFVGGTAMFPNRDALEYLLRDIWPSICRAQPQASLHVIGSSPAADRARFGSEPCVTVLGLVPDIRPHLAQASCCVVPLRVGGGTRLKILDAWGMGKAVVSTSIGCEGLDAVDDKNILVRDEAGAFADAVVHVLANSVLRARLGMNARNTAETHYDWTVVGQGLRREYWRIMNAGRSLPAQLV